METNLQQPAFHVPALKAMGSMSGFTSSFGAIQFLKFAGRFNSQWEPYDTYAEALAAFKSHGKEADSLYNETLGVMEDALIKEGQGHILGLPYEPVMLPPLERRIRQRVRTPDLASELARFALKSAKLALLDKLLSEAGIYCAKEYRDTASGGWLAWKRGFICLGDIDRKLCVARGLAKPGAANPLPGRRLY